MLLNEDTGEDLRVRRTRMLIENGFLELIEKKDFQSITIQEIADRAMINRATFYRHFDDKYMLFEHIMQRMFEQMLESKLPEEFDYCAGNVQFLIATVCDFLAETERHCGPLEQQNLPAYNETIVSLIRGVLAMWIAAAEGPGELAEPELTADVASWAIYGAAAHWSETKPRTESSEAFAARAVPLIEGIFKGGV